MDPVQVGRLKEEHLKGLRLCEEKISHWEKFKSDYETLEQRLETLPHQLSYDITVPFGPNAFTKGHLVHTNEILVLLGDNWFAEMSAKQAEALAHRRKDQCIKMLEDLDKEKKQFQNWLNYIDEVSNKEDLVEIVEKYDEEEEKKWREKHKESVRAHRRQMANRDLSGSSLTSEDEDHVMLEQMEELELTESNGSISDEGQHSEGEEKTSPGLKINIPTNNRESSSVESDLCRSLDSVGSPGSRKHVRWQDLTKQNVSRITFKHSRKHKNGSHRFKHQDSSENEEHPVIQSPSDIYEQFGAFFPASPPKSILKVKNSPPTSDPPMDFPESPTEECVASRQECHAFTGEVQEGSSDPVPIPEKKSSSSRPTSHFKSSRKNKRR